MAVAVGIGGCDRFFCTPEPLAGFFASEAGFGFTLLSLTPSVDLEEFVRVSFWTPPVVAAEDFDATAGF